jgi:glucose-6-phosphate dehydrogenase assembly protein OpcA
VTVGLDVRSVLDELAQRRRERHGVNVATMTMVVFFDDPAVGQWARDRTHALAVKHPSRVIVLDGTADGTRQVGATCEGHEDCVGTRGDWIELGVKGGSPGVLQSAVAALCLPEAPVVLFWVADGIERDARFPALSQHVRTVVYNSSVLDSGARGLLELIAFAADRPEAPICDVAYLRLAPWQESVALFFDAKHVIRDLFDLRRVEIACGSDPEAYYLLGWLASRLEWQACGPEQFCNRFGTTIDFAVTREGAPRRIRRIALTSARTHFVAVADGERADAIALKVSGEHAQGDRCRPINNIDIASLVERAILTGHSDRVFRDSLRAAGDILSRQRR